MNRNRGPESVPVAREEGERALGDDFGGGLEGVGSDLHVPVDGDAGEGLVECDHRRVAPSEFSKSLRVFDDLDREFRDCLASLAVAFGVHRRQTALADADIARFSKRFDSVERLEYVGIWVALEGVAGELANLLDARATGARIDRLEASRGVVRDSAVFEQAEDLAIDLSCATGGEKPAGVVVFVPNCTASDAGGSALADPGCGRNRRHVARAQRLLGVIEVRQRRAVFSPTPGIDSRSIASRGGIKPEREKSPAPSRSRTAC